jgi:sodium/proline symporter
VSTTFATFVAVTALIAVIGVAAARRSGGAPEDYLLASRSLPSWLVALSSVATNNSGYMFVGQIGLTYTLGLSSAWLAVGWIFGDVLVWCFVYPRVRALAAHERALSVPQLIAGQTSRGVVRLLAAIVIVFLTVYAAAQLRASSKALEGMLGLPSYVGAVASAALVLLYSHAGGLRASIWTDAVQSFVMMFAMSALVLYALGDVGGLTGLGRGLEAIDPELVAFVSTDAGLGFALWALGWIGGGLGAIGQPTLIVRTMALAPDASLPRAGLVYFAFFIPFYALTILLGLAARVLLPGLGDPEFAMPTLATALLPEVLVGVLLAGVFAATMSTADSQVLACSAAFTEDLLPAARRGIAANKRATLGVTLAALLLSLGSVSSVFSLVLYAWSALAATVGVITVGRVWFGPASARGAYVAMAGSLLVIALWQVEPLTSLCYDVIPAMSVGVLILYADARTRGTQATPISPPAG